MPSCFSFTSADLGRAAAAVATAALARPCPVLFFHPETAALVGAGTVGGGWVPRGPFVAVEPPRQAADAEELWQLARHRLVKQLARWRMQRRVLSGPAPTQAQLSRAADVLVEAEERRRLPGDWVALAAGTLRELSRADLDGSAGSRERVLWIPLAGMPQPFPWALAEARRRILAAHRAAGAGVSAFGFPWDRPAERVGRTAA